MRTTVLILLAVLVAACGSGDEPPTLLDEWNASELDMDRGRALLKGGTEEPARVAFQSAFDRTLRVFREIEKGAVGVSDAHRLPDRAGVLIRLAEISLWLSRTDPAEFRRAARLASQAKDLDSSRPPAWGLLGNIFLRAGAFDRAVDCLERYLTLARPEGQTATHADLAMAYYQLARHEIASGGLRSPGIARTHLTRAHELLGEGAKNPQVSMALEALNLQYAGEANPAAKRGDHLELARIHSRYGFLDLAKEQLDQVVRERKVVGEVRWVVARYWYEPIGNREMLEKADDVYTDLLKDGTGDEKFIAARVRVRRRLGRGDEVIEAYGKTASPGPELRVELIRAFLDRAARRDELDLAGWQEDARRIEGLLAGGPPGGLVQANLALETGFQAIRFRHRDHLERLVERYRKDWPKDDRVQLLESGLDGLRDVPLLPDETDGDGKKPEESR